MSDLARQQSDFQRAILTGDETVLAEVLDSPREKREVLFGVYKYAYSSRLVEAMRNDHEFLHLYLGDEMFDEMGEAFGGEVGGGCAGHVLADKDAEADGAGTGFFEGFYLAEADEGRELVAFVEDDFGVGGSGFEGASQDVLRDFS